MFYNEKLHYPISVFIDNTLYNFIKMDAFYALIQLANYNNAHIE